MPSIEDWSKYFDQNDVLQEQKEKLLQYIETLKQKNTPIIFEFEHLSKLIGFDSDVLSNLTISTKKSYRSFNIPKKRGGYRQIDSPYPALASCQKWILDNILQSVPLGDYSYAFRSDKSIIDNARIHLGNDQLLKIDISNFFGSIKIERIISIFKNIGYTNSLSYHLASICCFNECLPQGAPTSPYLSNIIGKRLDYRISALTKKLGLTYSRYADDIAISGKKIPSNLSSFIEKIVNEEGFELNQRKTVLKSKGQKKIITGLCISGETIRVCKTYRRQFRLESFYLIKNGYSEFNGTKGNFDPLYIQRMIGKANFILSIEPDNKYVKNIIPKLKSLSKA